MMCPRRLQTKTLLSLLIINPFPVCLFFQIGAYDQQIWEKSVEQREIKVCLVHFLLAPHLPCFCYFTVVFLLVFSFCALLSLNVSPRPLFLSVQVFFFFVTSLPSSSPFYSVFAVSHHAASSFPVFSFNSFLSALLAGCHLPRLSSLHLHPFPPPLYSLFLW